MQFWQPTRGILQPNQAWRRGQDTGVAHPFTLIANTGINSSGPTTGINTTGANLIVVSISGYQGNVVPAHNVTDNKSNTYTKLTLREATGDEAAHRLYYCIDPTVGTGHTFTYDVGGATVFGAMEVEAWSCSIGLPIFDAENGTFTNSFVTTLATGSVTPTLNNSLLVTGCGTGAQAARTYSIDLGFTITDQISNASGVEGGAMAYLKQSTAAATNPTWTQNVANSIAVGIASFKTGTAYVGPGDVVSGAYAWYGLRAYNAAGAAAHADAIDIVDQAGNNPTTIKVKGDGSLNVAAISAWVTANSVTTIRVTKLYDQTGGGLHMTQATLADMPTLTLSGLGTLPIITFTAANTEYLQTVTTNLSQPTTFSGVVNWLGSTVQGQVLSCAGAGPVWYHQGANDMRMYAGSAFTGITATDNWWHACQMVFNNTSSVGYIDGSGTTGTVGTQNMAGNNLSMARNTLVGDGSYSMGELGIWASGFTATQAGDVNNNQSRYYGFPATAWSQYDKSSGVAISGGNLVVTNTSGATIDGVRSYNTINGKVYFEVVWTAYPGSPGTGIMQVGIGNASAVLTTTLLGQNTLATGYRDDGPILYNFGGSPGGTGLASGLNDNVGVAVDVPNKKLWIRVNGGPWDGTGVSDDPATNTGGLNWTGITGAIYAITNSTNFGFACTTKFKNTSWTYAPPAGFGQINFAPSSSQSAGFFARAPGITSSADLINYDRLISGLVADGIWAKLDALYIFAAPDSTTAKLNLVSSSFPLTQSGTLTFTAYQGYTGNGSTGVFDTGLVPNAGGTQYALNSASLGIYNRTSNTTESCAPLGSFNTVNAQLTFQPTFTNMGGILNGGTAISTSQSNSQGFWQLTRTSSSSIGFSKNGGTPATQSSTSASLDNVSFTIFGRHDGPGATYAAFTSDQFSAAFIGGALTNTDMVNMSSRINTFMQAYGINVY